MPDLLVGRAGQIFLLEVKSDIGQLSKLQRTWHQSWKGGAVGLVRSSDEALAFVGLLPVLVRLRVD